MFSAKYKSSPESQCTRETKQKQNTPYINNLNTIHIVSVYVCVVYLCIWRNHMWKTEWGREGSGHPQQCHKFYYENGEQKRHHEECSLFRCLSDRKISKDKRRRWKEWENKNHPSRDVPSQHIQLYCFIYQWQSKTEAMESNFLLFSLPSKQLQYSPQNHCAWLKDNILIASLFWQRIDNKLYIRYYRIPRSSIVVYSKFIVGIWLDPSRFVSLRSHFVYGIVSQVL